MAVSLSPVHGFSKQPQLSIRLIAGEGVEGDAHCGATVQHMYLKRRNPAARAGVMSIVVQGGEVHPGVSIRAALPSLPHFPLKMI